MSGSPFITPPSSQTTASPSTTGTTANSPRKRSDKRKIQSENSNESIVPQETPETKKHKSVIPERQLKMSDDPGASSSLSIPSSTNNPKDRRVRTPKPSKGGSVEQGSSVKKHKGESSGKKVVKD